MIENQITVDINFCEFVSPEKLLENVNINHASVHLIVSWILPGEKINCLNVPNWNDALTLEHLNQTTYTV